jgi:protocatechuate 3,4-dioxygenase beta subunit
VNVIALALAALPGRNHSVEIMATSRRQFLTSFLALPALVPTGASAQPAGLRPTPSCEAPGGLTPRQTEGPFFTPNSPLKRNFAADAPRGRRFTVAGHVLTTDCRPVPGALIELWHADDAGDYDNRGYRLRGHQFSDDRGRWWFDTIVPGLYPGRTRHFHAKVQRPGGRVLTTQLYFPSETANRRDGLYDPALLLELTRGSDGSFGRFDFVVA